MSEPREPIYVNVEDCWRRVDVCMRDYLAAGYVVLNAPRPIGGLPVETWTGDFRAGIFYAAYSAGEAPAWGTWDRMDADEIRLITNDEVRERVTAQLAVEGYTLAHYAEVGIAEDEAIADVAHRLHLPWRREA